MEFIASLARTGWRLLAGRFQDHRRRRPALLLRGELTCCEIIREQDLPTAASAVRLAQQKSRASGLPPPDPFGDFRNFLSAAEGFVAQLRICDPRLRIVRDGHEPNEA